MAAQTRRIVVGYDGSEDATRALAVAADLVGYGSTLAVVALHDGSHPVGTAAAARRQLQRRHVEARYHEAYGEPAEELVAKAKELDADLLVVCRRGWGGLDAVSLSERVLRRASCDVLVVQ
jgi:nucleotide-binding universal stress UspA family protein